MKEANVSLSGCPVVLSLTINTKVKPSLERNTIFVIFDICEGLQIKKFC